MSQVANGAETSVAATMREAAAGFLGVLSDQQRAAATFAFADATRTRWTYLPVSRPGVGLLGLAQGARKAAHRLLGTALSRHAFAQAVTIMALEEVLDADEGGRRGRYSDNYLVAVFGEPGTDEAWAWRFEGHHLSVTATILGDQVVVAPLFLGANPARVQHRDRLIVGPLSQEEDLARAILAELPAAQRQEAVLSGQAPDDITTGTAVRVPDLLRPVGLAGRQMTADARDLLDHLVAIYLDRLTPALAVQEHQRLDLAELTFAWEGGLRPGEGHYYRLQAPGLLIEYDNTARNANHAHTVLRRPGADFGERLLPAHLATEQPR